VEILHFYKKPELLKEKIRVAKKIEAEHSSRRFVKLVYMPKQIIYVVSIQYMIRVNNSSHPY
jgi:hypothetical protein